MSLCVLTQMLPMQSKTSKRSIMTQKLSPPLPLSFGKTLSNGLFLLKGILDIRLKLWIVMQQRSKQYTGGPLSHLPASIST